MWWYMYTNMVNAEINERDAMNQQGKENEQTNNACGYYR
jgi:hypothetical protein